MKKIIYVLIVIFFVPALSFSEPCVGVTELTIGNHDTFAFCWDPNPEPDISHYIIYRDGLALTDGTIFESACEVDRCDSPTYTENQKGNHSYYVTAVDLEGAESDPSDPVTVTVINMPPGKVKNVKIK